MEMKGEEGVRGEAPATHKLVLSKYVALTTQGSHNVTLHKQASRDVDSMTVRV